MRHWTLVGLLICSLVPLASWAQSAKLPDFAPGVAGAQSILKYVLEVDHETREALTEALAPTRADCDSLILDRRLARKVYHYQRYLERNTDIVVGPLLRQQTEWRLWQTDADELEAYQGDARQFPGGYRELAQWLNPELSVYRFKFIEPGRKLGTSFDLLVYVNDHWCLIHRPWVVLF